MYRILISIKLHNYFCIQFSMAVILNQRLYSLIIRWGDIVPYVDGGKSQHHVDISFPSDCSQNDGLFLCSWVWDRIAYKQYLPDLSCLSHPSLPRFACDAVLRELRALSTADLAMLDNLNIPTYSRGNYLKGTNPHLQYLVGEEFSVAHSNMFHNVVKTLDNTNLTLFSSYQLRHEPSRGLPKGDR